MAVVFISPKKKQKVFIMIIAACLIGFLVVVTLWGFLAKPSTPAAKLVLNKPKVTIDLKILDSDQFKNLEPFEKMPKQFKFEATTSGSNPRKVTGYISAISEEEAIKELEARNLSVGSVKEVELGRENPFIPYAPTTTNTTNKTTQIKK